MALARRGVLLGSIALVALGACSSPAAETMACVSRFDCAPDETCSAGRCLPVSIVRIGDGGARDDASIEGTDAGDPLVARVDAGVAPRLDAAGMVDAGSSAEPDASLPDSAAPDAGAPPDAAVNLACTSPVTVSDGGAYCTIAEALAAAASGATVNVPAGTWAEVVEIARPVTLIGAGSSSGTGSTITPSSGSPAVHVIADDVTVRGFGIAASGGLGVEVVGHVALDDLAITGAAGAGVRLLGSGTHATITDVTITGVTYDAALYASGVELGSGTSAELSGSTISGCAGDGIWANGATLDVTATTLSNNGRTECRNDFNACAAGVWLDPGSTGHLGAMTVIQGSGAAGVVVMNATLEMNGASSTQNGIRLDVPVDGLYVEGNQSIVTLQNSTLSSNLGYGVNCWDGARIATCSGNTHTNNGYGWSTCPGC